LVLISNKKHTSNYQKKSMFIFYCRDEWENKSHNSIRSKSQDK